MEEATFRVEIKGLKATQITSRNRFKDHLKVYGVLDDKKFKTKKLLIGGGDLEWKFNFKCEYTIYSFKVLEDKFLDLNFTLSKKISYGRVSVDLYTLATGPSEQNLPILNSDKQNVGRLSFTVIFEQIANIAVLFKEIKLKGLPTINGDCNPYLKYGYSGYWPAIQEGKMKACYSSTREKTREPAWNNLPEIRFKATLKEMVHESIVLHVTHKGKYKRQTIARCTLLFRTLVENGKGFKDEDLISFKGSLKVENAFVEGLLVFKFLPKFAQMKGVGIKKPLHTERGILDGQALLPGLPLPKQTIITESVESNETGRTRAQTMIPGSSRTLPQNGEIENSNMEETKSKQSPQASSSSSSSETRGRSQSVAISKLPKSLIKEEVNTGPPMGTLITFSPTPTKKRSNSISNSIPLPNSARYGEPTFDPFSIHSNTTIPNSFTPNLNANPFSTNSNPFQN